MIASVKIVAARHFLRSETFTTAIYIVIELCLSLAGRMLEVVDLRGFLQRVVLYFLINITLMKVSDMTCHSFLYQTTLPALDINLWAQQTDVL